MARAPRELKAFALVSLDPGESRETELIVRRTDLAYWDVRVDGWIVEGGEYGIEVGASSRDLRSRTAVTVAGDVVELPLTLASSIEEALAHPVAGPVLREKLEAKFGEDQSLLRVIGNFPLDRLDGFPLPRAEVIQLVENATA